MKRNFLIKREQSQACLSYAKREKSRLKAKLFSLLVLLLTAVTGAWASKDVVPSDQVLSDYYNLGDVCVCIFVPENTAPYGIVFTGSYNGWSTNASQCATFQAVTGYDGWYVTSFEPEAEPDENLGINGIPVRLDASGNVSLAYNAGAATAIRGGVQIEQGAYAGEIKLKNFGADAPNVIIIDQWNGELSAPTADGYTLSVGENAHGTVKFYVGKAEVTKAAEGATVTVAIEPNTGWSVGGLQGLWYAAGSATKAPKRAQTGVDLLKDFELEPVSGQENAWSFEMKRANAEISVTYKKLMTNTDITVPEITAPTYIGQALEPTVTVKDGQTVLVKDVDYTVEYSNNTNAALATATENAPTVTIKGIGENYDGEITVTFTINKANITPTAPTEVAELTYTAQAQTLIAAGSAEGGEMQYSLDGETWATTLPQATDAGSYTVFYKVVGDANHNDVESAFISVPIYKAALGEVTLVKNEFTYNQQEQTATVNLVKAGTLTVPAAQFDVEGLTATDAGTYTVTVTGKTNFTGNVTTDFVIKPATLSSVTLGQTEFQYNLFDPVERTVSISEVKAGNLTVPAAQYEVEGNTQTEPGLYTVTVTGKTNFQGSVTADFVIKDQVVPGNAEKTESGEEVDDIDMTVSVVDRTEQTLSIDEVTGGTASGEGITVEIPASINGWKVKSVSAYAMSNMNNVTDIIMPDTEEPIEIEAGAFPALATIHTTLALLDDYALMASLQPNYEATKVLTTVTPANKYWTLGTGCDVVIPDGIDVYTVQVKNTAEVATEIVPEDQLKYGNERIVKANNGVLLLGEAGKTYDLWAYSGRIASGMPVATSDNKDYGQKNRLEPVVEKKHYESGHYFVLQNNEFHAILAEGNEVKVPAGKAVLHLGDEMAGARALVLQIDDSATGVKEVIEVKEVNDDRFYDLSGRRVSKPTKGIYVKNGKKVVVK